MLWRKFKLDWQYAIGELVIVTLGVLVALGIQQWNEERLEKQEEKNILQHLLIDLEVDLQNLEAQRIAVTEKEESLDRLGAVFAAGGRPDDPALFLQDVVIGANYGWNQNQPRGSTFQEILSSGKFGLVRNAELRRLIADHHSLFSSLYIRADARETEFPQISYKVMPRSRESDRAGIVLGPDRQLSDEDVERLVDKVLASQLPEYVVAEKNLARFILRMTADVREKNQLLIARIQEYLDSLN